MTDLRTAAQQALDWLYDNDILHPTKVSEALRAALAQQDEPVEPYTGDVTRIMRDAGMTFHLGLPHKAVVEQMTRVVDLVYAEASIKAAQQFAVALAQQAEPVEPVAWECKAGGLKPLTQRQYDAQTAATKRHYTRIAPPQRKPLTDEEINALELPPSGTATVRDLVRLIERAHGIGETK